MVYRSCRPCKQYTELRGAETLQKVVQDFRGRRIILRHNPDSHIILTFDAQIKYQGGFKLCLMSGDAHVFQPGLCSQHVLRHLHTASTPWDWVASEEVVTGELILTKPIRCLRYM